MKKAVVFGGSGFLGSYIADELTERGYSVVVADIAKSKYLLPNQEFASCDILNRDSVNELLKGVDYVYNFAGLADIDIANRLPVETMQLNIIGNTNILEACKNAGVKHFIYASSAYAVSNKGSFYGISKHASEKITAEYGARYGINYTIIRYGSIYGERADEGSYIYSLLKDAILKKKVVIKGDGEEAREYLHALDVARLSADIIEDGSFVNQHLILTGLEKFRRKDLILMISEILGYPLEIVNDGEVHEGHYRITPYSFHPNMAKKLVANPFVDLGQGIVSCIRYMYEHGSLNSEEK